jgi:hypothetical protein
MARPQKSWLCSVRGAGAARGRIAPSVRAKRQIVKGLRVFGGGRQGGPAAGRPRSAPAACRARPPLRLHNAHCDLPLLLRRALPCSGWVALVKVQCSPRRARNAVAGYGPFSVVLGAGNDCSKCSCITAFQHCIAWLIRCTNAWVGGNAPCCRHGALGAVHRPQRVQVALTRSRAVRCSMPPSGHTGELH